MIPGSWLSEVLLPSLYWPAQAAKTDQPQLRTHYQHLASQAQEILASHPQTPQVTQEERHQGAQWALRMTQQFQRSSSAVEGRNGYLSQVYHCRRGLSAKRLRVLTVIHNFGLKRPDGTTAAQRLYQLHFPDPLEYLLQSIVSLPVSRKSTKGDSSNALKLLSVPP